MASATVSITGLAPTTLIARGSYGSFVEHLHRLGRHHPSGGSDAVAARSRNDRHEMSMMADAVFSGGFLNACPRNADVVTMATIAPLVNGRRPIYGAPRRAEPRIR